VCTHAWLCAAHVRALKLTLASAGAGAGAAAAAAAAVHGAVEVLQTEPPSASLAHVPSSDGPAVLGAWGVAASPHHPHHALLVLSFLGGSRMLTLGAKLQDVTDVLELAACEPTVAAGAVQAGLLAQVHAPGSCKAMCCKWLLAQVHAPGGLLGHVLQVAAGDLQGWCQRVVKVFKWWQLVVVVVVVVVMVVVVIVVVMVEVLW